MNQFDLLKSHINAYTRKDGAVVAAHDDNRTASKPQFSEGDSVKVTGNVEGSGKKGVIHETAPSGHFHIVKHSDGSKSSYHESNLAAHDDDDEDEDEDDTPRLRKSADLLKSHIEAYTRKDGGVVAAHDDSRQASTPKTGSAAKAKFVSTGTPKWPSQEKSSEKLKKPHADGSTHHVGGFRHPEAGASDKGEYPDFTVNHDGKSYNYTGKQGKNMKTGEDSFEYSHKTYKDDGDEVTGEHRAWVTKSGHLMND